MTVRRVAVVEGEPAVAEVIRKALAEEGLACELCESAEQGTKLAGEPSVGALLLGLRLRDRSGLEVLRAIRERRPALRVIALGNASEQDLILEALRRGASDYLAKPIHEEELRLAVRRALDATETASRHAALCASLESLADALAGLGAAPESQDALAADLAETAGLVLGATRTSVLLADEEGALRIAAIRGGDHSAAELGRVAIDDSVAGLALAAGDGLWIDDMDRDPRCAGRARRGRYASRGALLVPLRGASGALGVLCATERPDSNPFVAEDLLLARLLALSLAPRFEALLAKSPPADEGNADEALRVELARGIAGALTAEVEPVPLLHAALGRIAELLEADPVSLYLVDAHGGELALESSGASTRPDRARLPRDRGLLGDVLRTGRLVALERPEDDAQFAADVDTPEDGAAGPLYCVPIAIRGRVLGAARAFIPAGRAPAPRTGEVIATALSAAVRNVLLYRSLLDSIDDLARARREASDRAGPIQSDPRR